MAVNGALKTPDDLIELGRITSAYGIRGWVKVQPHSAQAEVLRAAPVWWLCAPTSPSHLGAKEAVMLAHTVKQVRPQGATVVADLDGVGDRDIAESMRGYTVHVSRKDFPAATSDEYYWIDLVGCMVYSTHDAVLIGRVLEVIDNGAHALLRVVRLDPASLETDLLPSTASTTPSTLAIHATQSAPIPVLDEKGQPIEMLVPFVAAHVQHVDIAARRIDTDWPLDF